MLKQGDKVLYLSPITNREQKGVIFGIRKAEAEGREGVISYLIDTGKENPDHEGREDRQPELIDVQPKDVKPA